MTVREQLIRELEKAPDELVQAVLTLLRSCQSQTSTANEHPEAETPDIPSFFDVAQDLIGAGEGPGDLSTNPDYMQGYGE